MSYSITEEIRRLEENDPSLTVLNHGYENIGDEGARAIARALAKNTSVKDVNLYRASIGDQGVTAIARALEHNATVTELTLAMNSIGNKGATDLGHALETNTALQMLRLDSSSIDVEGARAIARALEKNNTLEKLYLDGNSIGIEGAAAVARALEKNTSLKELNLSWNSIGNDGATAVAHALENNITLDDVALGHNSIGNAGAIAIARALEKNTTLVRLELDYNAIGNEGGNALLQAMAFNSTIIVMFLDENNELDESIRNQIHKLVEGNESGDRNRIQGEKEDSRKQALQRFTTRVELNAEIERLSAVCENAKGSHDYEVLERAAEATAQKKVLEELCNTQDYRSAKDMELKKKMICLQIDSLKSFDEKIKLAKELKLLEERIAKEIEATDALKVAARPKLEMNRKATEQEHLKKAYETRKNEDPSIQGHCKQDGEICRKQREDSMMQQGNTGKHPSSTQTSSTLQHRSMSTKTISNDWLQFIRDHLPRDENGDYGTLNDLNVRVDEELMDRVRRTIERLPDVRYDEFYPPVIISFATGYRESTEDYPGKLLAASVVKFLFDNNCPCYSDLLTPGGINWEESELRISSKRAPKKKVIVVLMTRALFQSIFCLEELHYALENDCFILPVRVEAKSASGKAISRDEASMWPLDLIDNYARGGWNRTRTGGIAEKLHLARSVVTRELMSASSIPPQGSLLNNDHALDDLLKAICRILDGEGSNSGQSLILVVDDVPENNLHEIDRLKSEGYVVITTASTSSAMALLDTGIEPDIILSDMGRKEDSAGGQHVYKPTAGLLLIQEVRRTGRKMPIIIITTAGNVERYREETIRLGGNDIVCQSRDLFEAVSRYAHAGPVARPGPRTHFDGQVSNTVEGGKSQASKLFDSRAHLEDTIRKLQRKEGAAKQRLDFLGAQDAKKQLEELLPLLDLDDYKPLLYLEMDLARLKQKMDSFLLEERYEEGHAVLLEYQKMEKRIERERRDEQKFHLLKEREMTAWKATTLPEPDPALDYEDADRINYNQGNDQSFSHASRKLPSTERLRKEEDEARKYRELQGFKSRQGNASVMSPEESTESQAEWRDWLKYIRENLPIQENGKYGSLDDLEITVDETTADEAMESIKNLMKPTKFDDFYPKVVISYSTGYRSSKDDYPGKIVAAGVISALFQGGCPCYSDMMTPSGRNWEEYTLRLKKAYVLVVLMTEAFFRSMWCLEEVGAALDNNCMVMPVRVEAVRTERGIDISRDEAGMWPEKMRENHYRKQGWYDMGEAGRVNVSKWELWHSRVIKQLRIGSLPAHGSLLNNIEVLSQLVDRVSEILEGTEELYSGD